MRKIELLIRAKRIFHEIPTNCTIQGNIIQIKFGGSHFLWIFLAEITVFEQFLLAVLGIVIESEFGIQTKVYSKLITNTQVI